MNLDPNWQRANKGSNKVDLSKCKNDWYGYMRFKKKMEQPKVSTSIDTAISKINFPSRIDPQRQTLDPADD